MTLERLTLKNFQAHAKLVLDLDPRVTTLVGESDVGKSAVVRALRWLACNRPAGDAFVRRVVGRVRGPCLVRLGVDGRAAGRHRGGRRGNVYTLDGRALRVFGQGTPEDVARLLDLGEVNFQGQHDAPFWFALSAPEVARRLNTVVNLGLIDRTLANLTAAARQAQAAADVTRGRLKEARARQDALAWVPAAKAELEAVEAKYTKVKLCRSKASRLAEILRGVSQAASARDIALAGRKSGVAAVAKAEAAVAARQKAEALAQLLGKIGKLGKELADAQRRLHAGEARLAKALAGRCPLCGRT